MRFVVSAPAGGGLDSIIRKLAASQALKSSWGNVIVIENQPGSNGMVAIQSARNLPTDGSAIVAIFVNESPSYLAAYAPTLSALDAFVPIAYLGSNNSSSGKSWYGVYGPPGMSTDTARSLEAALQSATQSGALADLTTILPNWQQDRAVSAASLTSVATQTANASRQLASESQPVAQAPPQPAPPPVSPSTASPVSPDDTLCDVAGEEWTDRQSTETAEKYPFLAYLRVSNKRIDRRVHEFDLSFFRRCAKDEAEFQERTKWIQQSLKLANESTGIACGGVLGSGGPADENFKGLFNDEYIRNYNCNVAIPERFEEWFAKYQQDAQIGLDTARARMARTRPAPANLRADQACAARLKTIDNQLETARRDIPNDSIVALSEATLWAMAESIASIKAQCPQSSDYQSRMQALQTSYDAALKVCNGHAVRPCAARLPVKEIAARAPTPAAAPALKPLESKPAASCDEGTGANWVSCMAKRCAARGGELTVGKCASCAVPGSSWTICPKGSGGVSSGQ